MTESLWLFQKDEDDEETYDSELNLYTFDPKTECWLKHPLIRKNWKSCLVITFMFLIGNGKCERLFHSSLPRD